MRVELSKYEEQYVLGKGWITDWKYPNEETLRATISNPIIKKPDKNLVFEKQDLLSIEDHINLFLPFPKSHSDELPYKRYDQVTFAGIIKSSPHFRHDPAMRHHPSIRQQPHFRHRPSIRQNPSVRQDSSSCFEISSSLSTSTIN